MKDYIAKRAKEISKAFLDNNYTVREVAKFFGVSKSCAYLDLTERISQLDPRLHEQVREQLDHHRTVRHLRGGQATRETWKKENGDAINV